MKRIAMATLLIGSVLAAVPALAQYGPYYSDDDYDHGPRRGRQYEYRDYDRRPELEAPRRGYLGPPPGAALGGSCATPRGACTQTPALPRGSSCICFVPGAGNTPGVVR